jgi:hypothetical protein
VKAGWDRICSQFLAPVVKGEAMDVRLRIEEKKNRKIVKSNMRLTDTLTWLIRSSPIGGHGYKVRPQNQPKPKSIFKGRPCMQCRAAVRCTY